METGGFSEAMYYLDEALKQDVENKLVQMKGRRGRLLNHAEAYSLKAYMFAILGDYENAKEAIEDAKEKLTRSGNNNFGDIYDK